MIKKVFTNYFPEERDIKLSDDDKNIVRNYLWKLIDHKTALDLLKPRYGNKNHGILISASFEKWNKEYNAL